MTEIETCDPMIAVKLSIHYTIADPVIRLMRKDKLVTHDAITNYIKDTYIFISQLNIQLCWEPSNEGCVQSDSLPQRRPN